MQRVMLAGLLKVELPGHTVLLCDGSAAIQFNGDTYIGKDSLFGSLLSVETINEGVGDEAPAFTLSFLPDPDADAADLTSPDFQGCRLRAWIAEIDEDTGEVDGTPDTIADAIIDVPELKFPETGRVLELNCVSVWQRLLNRNEGNVLNGGFHKRIYPSEQGLDNTTGVSVTVAWGTRSPRGTTLSFPGWPRLGGGGGSEAAN